MRVTDPTQIRQDRLSFFTAGLWSAENQWLWMIMCITLELSFFWMHSYVAPSCGWVILGAFPSAMSLTASTWNQNNALQLTRHQSCVQALWILPLQCFGKLWEGSWRNSAHLNLHICFKYKKSIKKIECFYKCSIFLFYFFYFYIIKPIL